MAIWLMFLTWFILGTLIGTFLAHRCYNGRGWTVFDELEWWLYLVRRMRR